MARPPEHADRCCSPRGCGAPPGRPPTLHRVSCARRVNPEGLRPIPQGPSHPGGGVQSALGFPIDIFPGGSGVKASAPSVGDPGSIPGLGRSPGEGNGNPLQYSCLEIPVDGEAWWATVHRVAKSQTRLSDFTYLHGLNSQAKHPSTFRTLGPLPEVTCTPTPHPPHGVTCTPISTPWGNPHPHTCPLG